jgi:nucleotide-binding universal stress UspA family protein
MMNRILVPLDGSEQSEKILPLINELAKSNRAEIVLLRIVEYGSSIFPCCFEYPITDLGLMETIQANKQIACQEVEEYLLHITSTVQQFDTPVITTIGERPVVETILSVADTFHVDLIAMSADGVGYDSAAMWRIGSVADRVLHESMIPVMLFRLPKETGLTTKPPEKIPNIAFD